MPGEGTREDRHSNLEEHLQRLFYYRVDRDWYINTEKPGAPYLAHLCRSRKIEFIKSDQNLDGWPPCGEPIPAKVETMAKLAEFRKDAG